MNRCGAYATKSYPQKMSFDDSKRSQKVSDPVSPNWVPPVKTVSLVDSSAFSTPNALRWMTKNIMIQFGSIKVVPRTLLLGQSTSARKFPQILVKFYFASWSGENWFQRTVLHFIWKDWIYLVIFWTIKTIILWGMIYVRRLNSLHLIEGWTQISCSLLATATYKC